MKIFGFELFKKKSADVPMPVYIGQNTTKPTTYTLNPTVTLKQEAGYTPHYTMEVTPPVIKQEEDGCSSGIMDTLTTIAEVEMVESVFSGLSDSPSGDFSSGSDFGGFDGGSSGGAGADGSW